MATKYLLPQNFWDLNTIPEFSKTRVAELPYRSGEFNSRIVIVGEAPGAEETRTSLPFVGASGKILRRFFNNVYITNVIKQRPDNNDAPKYIKNNTNEFFAHVRLLAAELAHTNANVYVAVGETALQVLTGKSGIMKYHGSILSATLPTIKGRKVIPLIHPAAVLRNWKGLYPLFFIDCLRIKQDSKFPNLNIPSRNYIIRPSYEKVVSFLSQLISEDKPIAFDIETKNNTLASIQFANDSTTAIAIPFFIRGGYNYWPIDQEVSVWRLIQKLLYTKPLIGQNVIPFDIPVLAAHGFNPQILHKNVHLDTLFAMRFYEPQLPAGLDFLTACYSREPYYKDDGKEWSTRQGEEEFWIYGCKDVLVLQDIYPQLERDLIDDGKWDLYKRYYLHLSKYQLLMTMRGMHVDIEKKSELDKRYSKDIILAQAHLVKLIGSCINVNSPAQMKKLIYETLGFGKKAGISLPQSELKSDKHALLKLSTQSDSGVFQAILKVRELRKMHSTYIKSIFDSDGQFRCTFSFTETGRFTSSKFVLKTGGNLQNVPKDMRVMFIPKQNGTSKKVFLSCDGSQAEARVVAWYAKEQTLKEIFTSGRDIHSQVASIIFNKPVEEVDKNTERYIAKRVVHASNYGMGPTKFAMSFNADIARFNLPLKNMTVNEAKVLQQKYYSAFPNIIEGYQKQITDLVSQTKTITNPFGRKIRLHDRVGNELFREAFAFYAQSTVADYTNEILMRVSDHPKLILVNQVHDGLLFEINEDDSTELAAFINEKAQITILDDLIIPQEFEVGVNWKDLKKYSLTPLEIH